ncbi:translation initiation factor IF-2 [Pediococcus claussenii]|uniref:translation initiation factor IF-2 n=1 Tax=Pediococcus claussenii TaxID=187452 RepID=UPI00081A6060|nr:translation initiation factor IF-2 [Pediococcus claussenii]ANZ70477.1 translation initiation factor IF-2 [Pediococcus claussenii]ANZ72292.1 translation initiation factor IF-2 [Pediococcus claussenii]
MGKKRIYELAKELNVSSKDMIAKAQEAGFDVKNHMSTLDDASEKHLVSIFGSKQSTSDNKTAVSGKAVESSEKHTPKFRSSKTGKTVIRRNEEKAKEDGKKPYNPKAGNQTSVKTETAVKTNNNNARPQTRNNNQNNQKNQQRNNGRLNNNRNNTNVNNRQGNTSNNSNYRRNNNSQRFNNNRSQSNTVKPKAANKALEAARAAVSEIKNSTPAPSRAKEQPRKKEAIKRSTPEKNERKVSPNASVAHSTANTSNSRNNERRSFSKPAPTTSVNKSSENNDSRSNNRFNNNKKKKNDYSRNRFSGNGNRNNSYNGNGRRNKKVKKNGRLKNVETKPAPTRKERPLPDLLEYTEGMNVADIAKKIHREPAEIIKKLFMMGVMVNQNQSLDNDTIELLAADYGIEAQEKVEVDISDIDKIFDEEQANTDNLVSRPPVVTIMGHVDHGKTTLLDNLRNSHITAGEAGGITQGIGAYQLNHDGKLITFLDTPGHAAFTEMRARGADITDITILVVAADDGVMPQTIEAINHAKAADVPIIVAVNKIDKPGANPAHVIEQLAEYELIPEKWGGDTIFVEISAKMGTNINELLDMILLQAEVLELKANPDQRAAGSVIEAKLDPGKGTVATVLVQQGTMHVGDPIVIGNTFGRVRTMVNEFGHRVKIATPSTPVEVTGLNDVPEAGDRFVVFEDEKSARAAGEDRAKRALVEERKRTNHVTLDNLFDSLKEGEMKRVDIIIKADVQGSVEALSSSLKKIDVEGVRVNVIHTAVGAINESDVTLAEASNAIIIGFNVRPTPQAKQLADSQDVDIRLHRVIYNAIDEVEAAMKGMLEPTYEEEITGQVDIRETYKVSKIGTIAGGFVTDGFITRDSSVRLIRDGVVIYEGQLGSLRRFKDDVKEVKRGFELGLTVENYNDIKIGDVIEAYRMKEVPVE